MTQATSVPVEDVSVRTGAYDTHLLRAGAGNETAVLLLHGGGPGATARSNWMRTLPVLGERYDVIAPDLLGFGTTTHPQDPPLGPAAWLDLRVTQLVDLLDALGHERAVLVGNSLGGALTLHTAIAHPHRVESMVLMGSAGAPFKPGDPLLKLLGFYSDPTHENLRGLLRSFVYDLDAFGDPAGTGDPAASGDVDGLVDARLQDANREEARRSFTAMFSSPDGQPVREIAPDEAAISAIEHRALIVHGREDRIIPLEASSWMHAHLHLADLVVLGRCGHWAMLERPEAFNRIVTQFIEHGEV